MKCVHIAIVVDGEVVANTDRKSTFPSANAFQLSRKLKSLYVYLIIHYFQCFYFSAICVGCGEVPNAYNDHAIHFMENTFENNNWINKCHD